uniref:Cilia- and flagella-associated protein 206 n=1 Tax=Leptobrachium leishanense TaxID=445787 RepID=A0A8C5QTM1_9ANUR
MSHPQAESVIKNIIREIAQECASKGHSVSETMVAFMVKAIVLDARNGFNVDRTLTKNDVQKLIKLCVDRLLDPASPSLETIKMQVYFDMNYTGRGEFLEEHHRVLESRLAPVCREITDCRARTAEELDSLYRKIVSYVLLRSGLGSPTEIKVVREATAALQSVFPHTELGTFLSLLKKDKERQLRELTMIVTGIRLFNKDCEKGGEGIDDLPTILKEAIPIFQYTAVIEDMTENQRKSELLNMNHLKEALFNLRQHESFLNIIMSGLCIDSKRENVKSKTKETKKKNIYLFIFSSKAILWKCPNVHLSRIKLAIPLPLLTFSFPTLGARSLFYTYEHLLIKPITKCNSSTQTDTHILESNIVKSYEWNEWELRRKAIKLANLRQKVTHSMQTQSSHMRRENCSQVYLPKKVATQTKRDNSSNVPKPQVYMAGIRGGKMSTSTNMILVNLTRAVDES